jgi:hypothetical protein
MPKKLLLVGLAVGLALAAAEGGTRVALWLGGEPYRAAEVRAEFEAARAALAGDWSPPKERDPATGEGTDDDAPNGSATFPHPFFGWETELGDQGIERGAELFAAGPPPGEHTIVVVGGSVAALFAIERTGGAPTLEAALEADPRYAGRDVRVLPYGRGAFKQPQQLFLVAWLFHLGLVPDLVINLDGFNEVAIAPQNLKYGAHPLHPSMPQWGPLAQGRGPSQDLERTLALAACRQQLEAHVARCLGDARLRSAVLGRPARQLLRREQARWQDLQTEFLVQRLQLQQSEGTAIGPSFHGDARAAVELAVRTWRDGSLDLAALCARRGVRYLHVLQPTLHDPGAKIVTAEERRTGGAAREWLLGVAGGYPLLRQEGAALAAAGVEFLDASRIFAEVDETLYYDACHFGREGNRLLAEAIAAALLAGEPR